MEYDCSKHRSGEEAYPPQVAEDISGLSGPSLSESDDYDGSWRNQSAHVVILDEFDRFTPEDRLRLRGPLDRMKAGAFLIVTANEELAEDDVGLKSRLLRVQFHRLRDDVLRTLIDQRCRAHELTLSEAAVRRVLREANGAARDLTKRISAVDENLSDQDEPLQRPPPTPLGRLMPKGGRKRHVIDNLDEVLRRNDAGESFADLAKVVVVRKEGGEAIPRKQVTAGMVRRVLDRERKTRPGTGSQTPSRKGS